MRRMASSLVSALDLEHAALAEAAAWRNLIPSEPWTDAVAASPTETAEWVATRLQSGARNTAGAVVSARKGTQGVRPVPILGVAERIAYRALTTHVLQDVPPPQRGANDYRDFIAGPIEHAYEGLGPVFRLSDARLSHVVETDIAAFYQYVDHGVLQRETEMLSRRVEATGCLVELLGELQGSGYGLPQLLDPSDALSEIYIRLLEHDVVRRGLLVWRYNDDFRIGVTSYSAAQDAIEQLADAARGLGLVLNDHKTRVPRFATYALRHLNLQVDDVAAEIDPDDVEVAVTDYVDSDDQAAASAAMTLARMDLPPGEPGRIDLKRLASEDLRDIRRAINALGRQGDSAALSRIVHLFLFAPALTPRLCDYMISIAASSPSEVGNIWDVLTTEHVDAMSEWQAAWLTFVARSLNLLLGQASRAMWVRAQRERRPNSLLHAEASLALAPVGAVGFDELDQALRMEPEPFAPWYVLAMKALPSVPEVHRLKAVGAVNPFFRLLLDS